MLKGDHRDWRHVPLFSLGFSLSGWVCRGVCEIVCVCVHTAVCVCLCVSLACVSASLTCGTYEESLYPPSKKFQHWEIGLQGD